MSPLNNLLDGGASRSPPGMAVGEGKVDYR